MKRIALCLFMLAAGLFAFVSGARTPAPIVPADPWTPPSDGRERFEPITRVNIFLAQRPRVMEDRPRQPEPEPDEPKEDPGPPPPPPDPDGNKVLVGVSLVGEGEDRRPVMVIEDRSTGQITRVTELGPFSQGEITAADLNGLTYTVGDDTRQVGIGQALTGEPAPGSPPAPGSGTPGSTPGSAPATSSEPDGNASENGEESDVLRRLRERREREQ